MVIDAAPSLKNIATIQNALKVFTALNLAFFSYPKQASVSDGDIYDYIIVGGGTAGCVIASRLAESCDASVLLIEAGSDPEGDSDIASLLLFFKQSEANWNYTFADRGISYQNRRPIIDDMSLGKLLGGTSSTGYLLYLPGNHYDYDYWANVVNDTIWNWENVLPYFQKSQKLMDSKLSKTENGKLFGTKGKIGLTRFRTKLGEKFFKGFEQMGNERVPSFNSNISLGYTDAVYTLAKVRQSTANSYLSPIKNNPKLNVLRNAMVRKIIFDDNKNAIGVEVETRNKKLLTVKSRIEIILSAGVVNSPKLLMLSGIGPKKHLEEKKIKVISDLPVGQNLQDHLSVVVIYNMTNLVIPFRPWNPYKYPAAVLFGSVSLNKTNQYPDYFTINYGNFPLYLMMYCTFNYQYTDKICNEMLKTDVNSVMLYSVVSTQQSKFRGEILLKSNNYNDKPIVYSGYYSIDEDLQNYGRAVEHFTKVGETEEFRKMGAEIKVPELEGCNDLKKFSREYWVCYVKNMMTSIYNFSSTCAMGAVVDARLRVKGVRRLRVADASVMPRPTAGGTLAATIMIGEKVSDMIKEDNKIV